MTKTYFTSFFRLLIFCCIATRPAGADVVLSKDQLTSIGALGWIAPDLEIPAPDQTLPLVSEHDKSAGATLLRRYHAMGRAGGFDGVIYDNRDRGHSPLSKDQFPQLAHLSYGPDLREAELDYGLAGRIILPSIVFGNSSTALTQRPINRSQARFAMTSTAGPERAYLTYSNNHIYVYPEHRDHDEVDLFPANWPYMIISQGSSHSDKPFMQALGMTLAALSDETREFLREKRLIAPTLQMILRRNQTAMYRLEQYLSPVAHPTVFERKSLQPERMVAMAADLTPADIPPMVRLGVEQEDFSEAAGLAGLSERLFDTPSALARVWRSDAYSRQMVVTADKTQDPNGRPLSFEWVLLRGDPQKVRIKPFEDAGQKARIEIDWHDARPIDRMTDRVTDRVDIGVFASNGVNYSAPAFISVSFPGHQSRNYQPIGDDGAMRLVSVDYTNMRKVHVDPMLHWTAAWTDEFSYDAKGQLSEWRRVMPDETLILQGPGGEGPSRAPVHKLENVSKKPRLIMENLSNP